MKLLNNFYKQYQAANPMKFNEDLMKIRERDYQHLPEIIHGVLKSAETIEGVKIASTELITDETLVQYKTIDGKKAVSVYDERKNIVEVTFEITDDEKTEVIKKQIYVPKLLDGIYFLLNGNNYFPILQLVDTNIYKVTTGKPQFTLKTMIMPVGFVPSPNKMCLKDTEGNSHEYTRFDLKVFSKLINFTHYYLSKFGLEGSINFFKYQFGKDIIFEDNDDDIMDGFFSFRINKKVIIRVKKELFSDSGKRNTIASFIEAFNNRINLDKLHEQDYWIKKLGGFFSKNQNTKDKKAANVSASLERILITSLKDRLQLDEDVITDVYTLINYIISEGDILDELDNMDLANKRLRFTEYLIYPLATQISNFTYRLLNRVNKINITAKKQVTSIKPNIILDDIRTHDLIRYDNAVNGLALFQSILKVTIRGPQGINGDISAQNRDLHPSYVGKMSLVFSSPSSVGETNLLTPFCEIHDNLYFFKK